MGFVGDAINAVTSPIKGLLGGGSHGSNFQAQTIPLQQAVSDAQNSELYNRGLGGLNQQQAFLNALQGQNGLQNQANVFGQQQALANQLQNLSQGVGPNPAMAQLANTTGQNVANQAALMAGQRGAGSNAGLLARQIGQQGAGIQQQATGQAAQLAANQQLGAMGALQNQQGMMGNLAGAQVGQQANALNAYNQAAQNMYGSGLGAIGNYNSAMAGQQNSANSANAGVAQQNAGSQNKLIGGLLGAAGTAFGGPLGGAMGGALGKMFAHGGAVEQLSYIDGLISHFNQGAVVPGRAAYGGDNFKNDTVPAMLSPKEIVLPRSVTMSANAPDKAAKFVAAVLAKKGMNKK